MTTFTQNVASVIRGMLAEQNKTQTMLANRLERAQSYVSERETGKRGWTTSDMDVIADLLDMTPTDFMLEVVRRLKAAERSGIDLGGAGRDLGATRQAQPR